MFLSFGRKVGIQIRFNGQAIEEAPDGKYLS